MSNDPELLEDDRPCADCGDDVGPVEHTDTDGRPLCSDCIAEDDDAAEGWVCFLCAYRTPGMTLADRDVYDTHVRGHRQRLEAARRA